MFEWMETAFPPEPDIILEVLLLRLGLALVLGCVVAAIYRFTQRPESPASVSFVTTLVLLCILIALMTQIIGKNTARAFSLVGVLSIVRFRTVVEDTRDTAFVIFAVMVGMALGAGNLPVAIAGLGVVGLAAVLLRCLPGTAPKGEHEWTLQMRIAIGLGPETPWEAVFAKHCAQARLQSTGTARQGAALDFTYKVRLKSTSSPMLFLAEMNRLEGMQNLELKK